MDYPRIYNAATDMVDRNVVQGRATKAAFIDPAETRTYLGLGLSIAYNARIAEPRFGVFRM